VNSKPTYSCSDDRTVVLGLGRSGLSCIDFLVASGCEPVLADTRDLPPGLAELRARHPHLSCYLGSHFADALTGATRVLISPGLSRQQAAVVAAAEAVKVPSPCYSAIYWTRPD